MITPIEQLMTENIVSVPVGSKLFDAYEMMKSKRIRHLPVIDTADQVVGIISQKDLNFVGKLKTLTVESMMSPSVEYVQFDTSLRKTILRMLEKKSSCILVTDHKNNILGIVTIDDVLWHLAHLLSFETDEKLWKLNFPDVQTIGAFANSLSAAGI